MNLPLKLAHYRTQQNLSQSDLAELLQVSRQTISKWETGATVPALENIKTLSRLYGVTVDHLLDDDATPMPEEQPPMPSEEPLPLEPLPEKQAKRKNWFLLLLLAVVLILVGMKLCRTIQDVRNPHIPFDDLKEDKNNGQPDGTFDLTWD